MTQNVGKCPKCEVVVTRLTIERVELVESHNTEWHGITLVCPNCFAILGAAVDPTEVKNFVVEEVVHKLRLVQ